MKKSALVVIIILLALGMAACGGDEGGDNSEAATSTLVANDVVLPSDALESVEVTSVTAEQSGFVVIHEDEDGGPGDLLGHTAVRSGTTNQVAVALNRAVVDGETLWAMLHVDEPADGEFTFDGSNGEDVPAVGAQGETVVDSFAVTVEPPDVTPGVVVSDQFVETPNEVVIDSVSAAEPGYIVIHEFDEDDELILDPPIGVVAVPQGEASDITVTLDRDIVSYERLAAMLHVEGNGNDSYDGASADTPVTDDSGEVIAPTFEVRLPIEPLIRGLGSGADPADQLRVQAVVAAEPGYIVVYEVGAARNVITSPLLGVAPVETDLNRDVMVDLRRPIIRDAEYIRLVLHVEAGGDSNAYDGPDTDPPAVDSDGEIVAYNLYIGPGNSEPFVYMTNHPAIPANQVVIDMVIHDGPGWIVIHEDDNGSPGAVLGHAAVAGDGEDYDVPVTLDRATTAGETLHAMLHAEDGNGTFDFPGGDPPVTKGPDDEPVSASFVVLAPENSVSVADQPLLDMSTRVIIEEIVARQRGHIVIHEDNAGSPGSVLGSTPVEAGITRDWYGTPGTFVTLDRPVADGETLHAMLHVERGGAVDVFNPSTDTPARDGSNNVVSRSFEVSVEPDVAAVWIGLYARDDTAYESLSVQPREYYSRVVDGDRNTANPTITLQQGWRYRILMGASHTDHPLQFGEDDSTGGTDDWKLVYGNETTEPPFESDPDVNYVESSGQFIFTLTPSLAAELVQYQCQNHPAMMGSIIVETP